MGDNNLPVQNEPRRGGKLVRASHRYVAVIADMVGSRSMARSQRRVLQQRFARLIVNLNRDYRKTTASKFVITLGDEFQGLLVSATIIPDLLWRLEQDLPQRQFRVGVGLGTLDTPLQKYAINIDGPALHTARAAIEHAKKARSLGGVFRGFGELDDILTGIGSLLWFQRSHWTESQRNIASFLRKGMSQSEVAVKLGIKRQVVSRQVLAAGCYPYIAAESAWRMILEKQADPLLSSKHGLSHSH
ncbi:MAG: SatD family protein [Candidatus Sulfotelmatobacter sp.]